jgi:hypothetical protein
MTKTGVTIWDVECGGWSGNMYNIQMSPNI